MFCPAFVAYPYIFTDVLDTVLGTIMRDVVQPLFLHCNFRILYIEAKSKVEGRQERGNDYGVLTKLNGNLG